MRKYKGTNKNRYLMLFATVITASSTGYAQCSTPEVFLEMPRVTLQISDKNRQEEFVVRLADSRTTRMAGYQNVCPVDAKGSAILFVFPYAVDASFHMNNVYVNLDIVFFNQEGAFINHQLMTAPKKGQPSDLYHSKARARYALELPAGQWAKRGFTPSAMLEVLE